MAEKKSTSKKSDKKSEKVEKAVKPQNTLFVTKEEKALAEKANLMSLRTRATVQEIAEASLSEDGNLDKELFVKNLKRKFKKVTGGKVFEDLVDHIAGKYSS